MLLFLIALCLHVDAPWWLWAAAAIGYVCLYD